MEKSGKEEVGDGDRNGEEVLMMDGHTDLNNPNPSHNLKLDICKLWRCGRHDDIHAALFRGKDNDRPRTKLRT